MADVVFIDAAIEDLRRLGPDIVPKVLKKVLLLCDDPEAGHPLAGALTGYRKLVVGRNHWRIVYRVTEDGVLEICEIWCVGARSDADVYREATARVAAMSDGIPEVQRLSAVIERLGRMAGGVVVEAPPLDPVPDWLANRLIHTVGVAPEKVAALGLEQAVDLWTAFISGPGS